MKNQTENLPFVGQPIRVKRKQPKHALIGGERKKKLVLSIEDDIYLIKTLRNILLVEGYDVISADSGEDGIRMIFELYPDVILCDIAMTRVDGYDVLKIAKSSPVTERIPFIFLTGRVNPGEEIQAVKSGVDGFIKKPFEYGELLNELKNPGLSRSKGKNAISRPQYGLATPI